MTAAQQAAADRDPAWAWVRWVPPAPTTHDALMADLADWRRRIGKRITFENMSLDGHGPRPDVYSLVRTLNPKRMEPFVDEVKVDRGDFLADVRAQKFRAYEAYSALIFFACPEGLIRADEVPAGCGLLYRSAVGWRPVVRPRRRRAWDLTPNQWMKLVLGRYGVEAVVGAVDA